MTAIFTEMLKGRSGFLITFALAAAAYGLGALLPLVGGAVIGILLGIGVKAMGWVPEDGRTGIRFCSKSLLQASIVLLGAQLSLGQVWEVGSSSLWVMLPTLVVCLGAAWLISRAGWVRPSLVALIGVGTGICGASAIAATAPVIDADEDDVAYAVSTIFAYNVAAVVIFPALGHLLGLSQAGFGLWAGTAINDTSSVVAAAFSYGSEAGSYATVVKLARATMIIPVVLCLAWVKSRERRANVTVRNLVPWFLVWFLAAAFLNSLGVVPDVAKPWLLTTGKFLIVVALTAVGLSADLRKVARSGLRPFILGAALWVLVAGSSLLLQRLTGQL